MQIGDIVFIDWRKYPARRTMVGKIIATDTWRDESWTVDTGNDNFGLNGHVVAYSSELTVIGHEVESR